MRGLPYRATETDIYNVRQRANLKISASTPLHLIHTPWFIFFSFSRHWIQYGSTLKLAQMAEWRERQTSNLQHTRMPWQPCLKIKPTCVSFCSMFCWHIPFAPWVLIFTICHFSPSEHRYVELFLNSTAGGSNGSYGSQMMGGMGKYMMELLLVSFFWYILQNSQNRILLIKFS